MSNYLSIGIKIDSQSQIEQALPHSSIAPFIKDIENGFNVRVSVGDYRNDFTYGKKFLKDNGLDDDELLKNFDMEAFGVMVDFTGSRLDNPELRKLVLEIARQISKVLGVQTIFMKDNLENPVALFDNGELVQKW